MKSLKMNFYFTFIGLGMIVSLGMGLIMFIQYRNYIKTTYSETLSRTAALVEKQYPVLHDPARLKQGAAEDADWFWEISQGLANIAESVGLEYIYYIEKTESNWIFLLSSIISRDSHPEWLGGPVWAEGTPVPEGNIEAWETQKPNFPKKPVYNEWGALFSIRMPIITNNKTVGLLGVSYNISFVKARERNALIALVIAFGISAMVAGLLAFAGSQYVFIPIQEREKTAQEAIEGQKKIEKLALALKGESESKSAFLANISHEMRTPMNAIIGLSSLMLVEKDTPATMHENLETINVSGIMLLGVINDILDINKIEAGKLEIVPAEYDLADMVSGVAELHAALARDKSVQFDILMDEKLPRRLRGDMLRIRQICNKILSNAFKYTSEGKVAWRISCEGSASDSRLVMSVSDTGIGIRPEHMAKLFTDYGQLDGKANRRAEGTGLGLSIANRLALIMGGSITVKSDFGKGSIFTLQIPQEIAGAAQIGPEIAESLKNFRYSHDRRSITGNMARVQVPGAKALVVDDMPTNLKITEGIIRPCGMHVDCVSSGSKAIELIREAEVKYDIVFMDYMMPEMDGIEATKIIRGEIGTRYAKTVPIIALTAADVVGKENMFLQNGFNAFLSKPIDIISLDTEINRWVRDAG